MIIEKVWFPWRPAWGTTFTIGVDAARDTFTVVGFAADGYVELIQANQTLFIAAYVEQQRAKAHQAWLGSAP